MVYLNPAIGKLGVYTRIKKKDFTRRVNGTVTYRDMIIICLYSVNSFPYS